MFSTLARMHQNENHQFIEKGVKKKKSKEEKPYLLAVWAKHVWTKKDNTPFRDGKIYPGWAFDCGGIR